MKYVIAVPARYHSTRLPGKPLIKIAGREMLLRVWDIALAILSMVPGGEALVCTEDQRIVDFCVARGIPCSLTSADCRTGTDRVIEACQGLNYVPDIVLNLQGDNPFCPVDHGVSVLRLLMGDPNADCATPAIQLSWAELDSLRENKKTTPFSGTTVTYDKRTRSAFWFSKQIIPAIRNELTERKESSMSPIFRHVGLYAYRWETLRAMATLPTSFHERLEGLEQLRLLENGRSILIAECSAGLSGELGGIDSQEDVNRAESMLARGTQ